MRITNNMMVSTLMTNLTRNMNRMSNYQDQLATGKHIINASDDPVGTSKILKYKSDIAALEQYEKNTGDSLAWLEVTESSISDTGDVLQRMRELAVQAANGTNSTEDTQKIAMEIKQMKEHLINNGNFSYAGRYAFSGYQTDTPLFNEDGSYRINITDVDSANKPKLQYQVSIGQDMDVTTNGLDVFGYVKIDNLMTQSFPHGEHTGSDAIKASLSGTVNPSLDLTGLGAGDELTVTVDSIVYTLDGTKLSTLGVPIQNAQVLDLINNAEDGGGIKLGSAADVIFDANGELTIRSKQAGSASNVSISFTGSALIPAAFDFPPVTSTGVPAQNAIVKGAVALANTDLAPPAGTVFSNKKFIVTYNGVQAEINLGSIPPASQGDLIAMIKPQLQAKFGTTLGVDNVTASFGTIAPDIDHLIFTGLPQTVNGESSTLEVRTIRATESQLMVDIDNFVAGLETGDATVVGAFLGKVDGHLNQILSVRADIGARVNRMELVANRISDNTISYTTMLSDVQDADMAGVIMYLKNAENVYKAALSTGSKVIQPSLIDYLR